MSHSPEPWDTYGSIAIIDAKGRVILGSHAVSDTEHEEDVSNIRRTVAMANFLAGVPLEKFEGKTLAEFVASETLITGMAPDARGGFGIQLEGGACHLLAEAFAEQFKGSGAINYLEVNFVHDELGGMSVTMQRTGGKTPGQLKAEAVAQRYELLAALKHLEHNARKSGAEMGLALDVAQEAIAKCESQS